MILKIYYITMLLWCLHSI